ncbi:MAG: DMT family transporter [Phreatobacter sp.]|uniref:DMT family transporter n=1 Tax=Phreatobacter sp. TaxID=1966341 RepID=UPI002735C52B|nr:DMT family transporter [Phreatobacter sp.]MDP2800434.1 DMT family transporter [Phreatobacter sp.]
MDPIRFIPPALAILWGLNWPAVKIGLSEVPPFALRMGGMGAGGLILLAVALMSGRSLQVARRDVVPLVVGGFLSITVFNLAVVFAQLNTTTSRAAILTFTTPLWAIVLAYLVLGERLDRARIAALVIGLAGIGVLASPIFTGAINPLGVLFPVIAAVSWAAGSVYLKRQPLGGERMVVIGYQLLLAAGVAAIGFAASGEVLPTHLSTGTALAIAYHVIGATSLAYLLWFTLLDRLTVGAAAMTTFAIPVVGVASAMVLVGDRPGLLDYAGFAAVIAAAGLATFGTKRA